MGLGYIVVGVIAMGYGIFSMVKGWITGKKPESPTGEEYQAIKPGEPTWEIP